MAERDRIVAVGLLSEKELALVGQTLRRVYRIDDGGDDFADLLQKIDAADDGCTATITPRQGN